jgi:MFS family permease
VFSGYTKTFAGLTAFTTTLAFFVTALTPDRIAVTLLFLAAFCFGLVTAAGRNATGHNDRVALLGASRSANRAPRNSYAPALAAIGAGALVLGAALGTIAYAVGGLVLLVAGGIWLSDTWREHPLSTPKQSAQVSRSFSLPFVMPILSLVLIAFVAISFSFVFFSFPENRSWIVAATVATLIFGGAFVLAFLPQKATRAKFLSLVALLMLVIASLGLIGLLRGAPPEGGEGEKGGEAKTEVTSKE